MATGGILDTALSRLFRVDWPFQERARVGLGTETAVALDRFWAAPELAGPSAELGLPHRTWQEVTACCARLAQTPRQLDEPWVRAARLAEAYDDPVAGAVAALYAVAAWEGALGDNLYFQPWQGHHWGWHVFPLSLARAMMGCDAVWSAEAVADRALEFVESAKGFPLNEALYQPLADYAEVQGRIQRRLNACVANLAWDLRASASGGGETFRAELAAMLWTLGDVPHAERVAGDPAYTPPLTLVQDVVEVTMGRLAADPFLQYVWLELKDRPPFDLRGHKVLFAAINNVYYGTGVHQLEETGLFSPSRAYARALIEHFRGRVSEAAAIDLEEALEYFRELMGMREPVFFLRLGVLYSLVIAGDDKTRRDRWTELAEISIDIMERSVRRAVFQPLNNALDLPLAYLDGASDASLDAIERYRCGALAYWLAVTAPPAEGDPGLLEEEGVLLRELRGARFIRLLPYLPAHYRRHGF
ncbi:MAG TPA: hypothetical protein VKE25_15100, partial [Actinomycetes bacterium]|nr:hypothetical protein [Actinomycetes bacterium]